MAWNYTVTISEIEPTSPELGRIWIKPTLSQVYIYIGVEWVTFAGSGAIGSYVVGSYAMTVIIQEAEPAISIGQIWIKESLNTVYFYLDGWLAVLGV